MDASHSPCPKIYCLHLLRRNLCCKQCLVEGVSLCLHALAWKKTCPIERAEKKSNWLLWGTTEFRTPSIFRPLNEHIFCKRAENKWYTFLCTNGRFRYIYIITNIMTIVIIIIVVVTTIIIYDYHYQLSAHISCCAFSWRTRDRLPNGHNGRPTTFLSGLSQL